MMVGLGLSGCSDHEVSVASISQAAETESAVGLVADEPLMDLPNLGPAPAWILNGLNGKGVKLSDFAGKVVVLDFWATYCPPCVREMPEYVKLQRKYGEKGLVIVGLSGDRVGPMQVLHFTTKLGVNYPIVMADYDTADAYNVDVLPTSFVLDREGNIRFHRVGAGSMKTMEQVIRSLL